MDNNRRLALALALVVAVVVLTQLLFPTRRVNGTAGDGKAGDVTAVSGAAGDGKAGNGTAEPSALAPGSTVPGATVPGSAVSGVTVPGPTVPAVPAETLSVATRAARYAVSTAGASLVGAEMLAYQSQAPASFGGGRPAQLAHPGDALLAYRIVLPGDTIPLSRTVFNVTPAATPSGAGQTVRLDGMAQTRTGAALPVSIVYGFGADGYAVSVRGSVGGIVGPAYLLIDLPATLRVTEKDSADHFAHLAYTFKPNLKDASSLAFAKLEPGEREIVAGPLTWAAAKSKYFLVGVLAPRGTSNNASGTAAGFEELTLHGGVRTSKLATRGTATLVESLGGTSAGAFAFDLYAGPQAYRPLVAMGRDFENTNPYGGFMQGLIQPFATMVIRALLWMHDKFNLSYGWVLILFGVGVRIVFWPLQQKAMRSQLKMQRVQPELQAVQEKFKGDPQRQQQEIMKVYAAHGMSPFSALSGCLPMLLPLPIFFALFFVFQNTIEFRGVPFFYLPDIALKDPYYILPILVAVTQFLMSWIGMRGMPPNPQTQMLTYAMPAMFLFFFINVASGLNLYYLTQNLIMLPQQWLLARERQKVSGQPVIQGTPTPTAAAARRKA